MKNLMTIFAPDKQHAYCRNHFERMFIGDAPTLWTLRLAYGDDAPEVWLMLHITELSEFAGSKDKLATEAINELSKVITTEYGFLKVTELMYFFVLFKSGRFGRFYGAVDALFISTALHDFLRVRTEELTRIERREQERRREEQERYDKEHAITWEEYLRRKELRVES